MNLVEQVFTRANHGTTIGFRRKNGRIDPILDSEFQIESASEWKRALELACDEWVDLVLREGIDEEILKDGAIKSFHSFSTRPRYNEAGVVGTLSVGMDPRDRVRVPLVKAYSHKEAIRSALDWNLTCYDKVHADWLEGSLVVSTSAPVWIKLLIRTKLKIRHFLMACRPVLHRLLN